MRGIQFKALQKSTGMGNLKYQLKAAKVPSTRKGLWLFWKTEPGVETKGLYYLLVYFWRKKNKLWILTKKPQTLKNHSHLRGCSVRVKKSFLESNSGEGIRRSTESTTTSKVPSARTFPHMKRKGLHLTEGKQTTIFTFSCTAYSTLVNPFFFLNLPKFSTQKQTFLMCIVLNKILQFIVVILQNGFLLFLLLRVVVAVVHHVCFLD